MESKSFLFRFGVVKSKKPMKIVNLVIKVNITTKSDDLSSYPFMTLSDGSFGIPAINEYSIDTKKSSQDYEKWFDINQSGINLTVNSKTRSYGGIIGRRPLVVLIPRKPNDDSDLTKE